METDYEYMIYVNCAFGMIKWCQLRQFFAFQVLDVCVLFVLGVTVCAGLILILLACLASAYFASEYSLKDLDL